MKTWQILVFGSIAIAGIFLLMGFWVFGGVVIAMLMVAAVIFGFMLQPDRDSWRVIAKSYRVREGRDSELDLYAAEDLLTFRADITRLWLLFIPTVIAVSGLVVATARGNWAGVEPEPLEPSYWTFWIGRFFVTAVAGILGTWVFERWLLRRADACHVRGGNVSRISEKPAFSYYFVVNGDYYGGSSFPIAPNRKSPELNGIVMYRRDDPDQSRLIPAFLFHQFDVVARGIEDLENARAEGAKLQRTNLAAQE